MPSVLWMFPMLCFPSITVEGGILDSIKSMFDVSDKDVSVKVDQHKWERTIAIEVFENSAKANWCNLIPSDADVHGVQRKTRKTEKVKQRMVDSKLYTHREMMEWYAPEKRLAEDGRAYSWQEFTDYFKKDPEMTWFKAKVDPETVSEKTRQYATGKWNEAVDNVCKGECCPNCHDEQVPDFWCEYTAKVWMKKDVKKAAEATAFPYWPEVNINECSTPKLGCERRGAKSESYSVALTMTEGGAAPEKTTCTDAGQIDFPKWQLLEAGNTYTAKKRKLYGLLCGSIQIPHGDRTKKVAADGKAYIYEEFVDWYGSRAGAQWQYLKWADKGEL